MPDLKKEIIYPKTVLLSADLLENLNHTFMYILTNQATVLEILIAIQMTRIKLYVYWV